MSGKPKATMFKVELSLMKRNTQFRWKTVVRLMFGSNEAASAQAALKATRIFGTHHLRVTACTVTKLDHAKLNVVQT